jgi:hypothetical protein
MKFEDELNAIRKSKSTKDATDKVRDLDIAVTKFIDDGGTMTNDEIKEHVNIVVIALIDTAITHETKEDSAEREFILLGRDKIVEQSLEFMVPIMIKKFNDGKNN